jgi:tape measure domain-containing protein
VAGVVAAFGAYQLGRIAHNFLETAASVETLKIQLDTITQGRGLEWFERLNEWALKMPIDTQGAIRAFKNLRAMGLDFGERTTDVMTTLVDTTSALGGGEDVLMGIVRALGQMYTKGKASAEELMQLAERGIPAYEILAEKLNLTGEQVQNIATSGIDVRDAIDALIEGMTERFGGASESMQSSWKGMVTAGISYWKEFQRLVMESGPFEQLKEHLAGVIAQIDRLKESGELVRIARETGATLLEVMAVVVEHGGKLPAVIAAITRALVALGQGALATAKAITQVSRAVIYNMTLGAYYPKWLDEFEAGVDELGTDIAKMGLEIDDVGPKLAKIGLHAQDAADRLRGLAEDSRASKVETEKNAEVAQKLYNVWKPVGDTFKFVSMTAKEYDEYMKSAVGTTTKAAESMEKAKESAGNFSYILWDIKDTKLDDLKAELTDITSAMADLERQAKETRAAIKAATSSGGAPGMALGGLVAARRYQGGGIISGYGGGDQVPAFLEPGEFVLRKEAVRGLGLENVAALNRMTPAVTERAVLELRLGGAAYPVTVEKSDTYEGLLVELRRRRMVEG